MIFWWYFKCEDINYNCVLRYKKKTVLIARQLEKCNSMTDLSHDRNARHLEEMITQSLQYSLNISVVCISLYYGGLEFVLS